jgi:hypothetical protein
MYKRNKIISLHELAVFQPVLCVSKFLDVLFWWDQINWNNETVSMRDYSAPLSIGRNWGGGGKYVCMEEV